jgi:ribonuclease E
MSRQRLRPGMLEATTQPCSALPRHRLVRSDDSLGLSILRQLEEEGTRGRAKEVLLTAPVGIVNFLINHKRDYIEAVEGRTGLSIRIEADIHMVSPDYKIERFKTATRRVAAVAPITSMDAALMDEIEEEALTEDAEVETRDPVDGDDQPRKKRRRRRGGRGRRKNGEGEDAQDNAEAESNTDADAASDAAEAEGAAPEDGEAGEEQPKKKRRGRRGGRGRKPRTEGSENGDGREAEATTADEAAEGPETVEADAAGADAAADAAPHAEPATEEVAEAAPEPAAETEPAPVPDSEPAHEPEARLVVGRLIE